MQRNIVEIDQQRQEWEQQLIEFKASNNEELSFPSTLTNVQRMQIHKLCARHGLASKSTGKGRNRTLSVSKGKRTKQKERENENHFLLHYSTTSLNLLKEHIQKFPPTRNERIRGGLMRGEASTEDRDKSASSSGHQTRSLAERKRPRDRLALSKSPEEIQRLWKLVRKRRQKIDQTMEIFRSSLPAAKHKDEILNAIALNRVLLISGDTGSGKTTQVPQYILDDAWSKNTPCRILCTQPRRLAAIMVATRVAEERGEPLGQTVGYRVMLDKICGPECALIYATTGIVLKDMTIDTFSGAWTHLIIDEVHERDHNSDFLLIVLRDILPKHPHLKVILMSATLHKELFVEYFGNCPALHIEGRNYPVTDYYLEDILNGLNGKAILKKQPRATDSERVRIEQSIRTAFLETSEETMDNLAHVAGVEKDGKLLNLQHSETGLTALAVAVIHGYKSLVQQFLKKGADPEIPSNNGLNALQWAEQYQREEIAQLLRKTIDQRQRVISYTPPKNGDVDFPLLVNLIKKICVEGRWNGHQTTGSILVFLSGWKEILNLRQQLIQSSLAEKTSILCLHSKVSSRDQKMAFLPPPEGKRKIVLSTPIAETSITINDISVVINCGRMKEKSFDAVSGVSALQSRWISKANQTQRAGRAGRCQEGIAFHVYTKQEGAELDEFVQPEICRISLDEVCLQARVCLENYAEPTSIQEFLQKAPDPPSNESVKKAVQLLIDIDALTKDQQLTILGRRLASLPMEPRTGKMILSPWVLSVDNDDKIKEARKKLSDSMGGCSDHLATVSAYNIWNKTRSKQQFCYKNFLSSEALSVMDGLRRKIQTELRSRGMIIERDTLRKNADDLGLVRSLLACGMYPFVGVLKKRCRIAVKDRTVDLLNSSINTTLKPPSPSKDERPMCPLLAFEEMTRGDFQIYVRDTTAVQPHPLPLIANQLQITDHIRSFAGPLKTAAEYEAMKTLVVDNWLSFDVDSTAAECLAILRLRLQDAFARKVANPRSQLPSCLEHALKTIARVLSHEATSVEPQESGITEEVKSMTSSSSKRTSAQRNGLNHMIEEMTIAKNPEIRRVKKHPSRHLSQKT